MNLKTASVINIIGTLILCLFLTCSSGGCSAEQMQTAANVAKTIETIAPVVAPLVPGISWPVWSVMGIDIISSLLAAVVAFRKQQSVK